MLAIGEKRSKIARSPRRKTAMTWNGKTIERRVALKRLALGILGSCWTFVSCAPLRRNVSNPRERLREDLAKLVRPAYSEEGVPVILLCENLTKTNPAPSPREGRKFAAEFRELAEVFAQIQPDRSDKDIPKLVEVLAYRDFGAPDAR